MVYEDEWSALKKLFSIEKEICVTRNRGGFISSGSSRPSTASVLTADMVPQELLSSEPKVCLDCVEKKRYFLFFSGAKNGWPILINIKCRNI